MEAHVQQALVTGVKSYLLLDRSWEVIHTNPAVKLDVVTYG